MIKKLIQNKAFSYSITSAALVMMIAILGVKVTGFLRQALYSQSFGSQLDVFYAANLIPEVIFNIIALGSINAVLIPVMTKAIAKEGNVKASHIFSSIINVGILVLTISSILMAIFTPALVDYAQQLKLIAKFNGVQLDQLVIMMRLLLISPAILGMSSVISAMLHIKRHFLITQLSPLVYNLSGIFALFTFVPFFGIYGLAYGVILGSVLHLVIQIPSFKSININYSFKAFDLKNKYTKDTGRLMAPRLFSLAGEQIVFIVQTIIALFFPLGAALYTFRNAMLIRDIPISLFGVTLAQAAFPTLSAAATDNDITNFKKYFIRTFQQIVFFVAPFTAFILVLRLPIARMAFGVGDGQVSWDDTKVTAMIIFFMALGILWMALVNLMVRAFYSLSNTIIPVVVSLVCVTIEIVLSLGFANMFSYLSDTELSHFFNIFKDHNLWELLTSPNINGKGAIIGVALASAIGSFIQIVILSYFLSKKIRVFKKDFFIALGKKLASAILLGISAYITMLVTERFLPTNKTFNVLIVLCASFIVSFSVYLFSEFLLSDDEFSLIRKMYKKIKGVIMRNRKILNQVYKSFIISQEKKQ
ncbi:MAG: lipid II flippase MurJ [bacterium]